MMSSVPAGNALVFTGPDGALLDTPMIATLSRDVTISSEPTLTP